MDRFNVYHNNICNKIVTPSASLLEVRRFGLPFLLWKINCQSFVQISMIECFLTNTELSRIYRRSSYPTVDRLCRILKRSGHDDFDVYYLNNLTKFCRQCQIKGKSPERFKFKFCDEFHFNYSIIVNVIYFDGKPVLHIIDKAIRIQPARYLCYPTSRQIWDTTRYFWIDIYAGDTDWIISNAGTNFVGKGFVQHASSLEI